MPVSIVVGGQFGSEGKGKVAHWLAARQQACHAVRVGGPNSGHTALSEGRLRAFRQLPTCILHEPVVGVIPAGAYVDEALLLSEAEAAGIDESRLLIHPDAVLLDESMREEERRAGLVEGVASTGQGVGAALRRRVMRMRSVRFARDSESLRPFLRPDLGARLAEALDRGGRIVIEGTQGFGLSLLHGGHYPFATSRDTTAAGMLSEAGLSPRDVDCVSLVIRALPIRVQGNSGPLPRETSWAEVRRRSGAGVDLAETTTATGRRRRVARFDPRVVRRAIAVNRPSQLVLNHVDLIDCAAHGKSRLTARAGAAVADIESSLGARVDYAGTGPGSLISRPAGGWACG